MWAGTRAMTRSGLWKSYVAVIVAAILWGSLYPAGKLPVAAVGPLQVAFCRTFLAAIALLSIAVVRGNARSLVTQARTRWRGIVGISFMSFSGSSVIAMIALGMLPASVNGLLNNTHPLWIALGTAAFVAPRRPALLVVGSLLALVGVGLVFFPDLSVASIAGPNALDPQGVLLSLFGSGVIAASTVLTRQVMKNGDPIAITALASALGVPFVGILVAFHGGFGPIFAASGLVLLLLLHVGIGCTALNFALWFYGLQRLPAAQASAFQYLIPPVGVLISSIALHESLTAGLIVGGGLILVGLLATQVATSERPPALSHQAVATSS
jgi:drug/metabolite transporter (DMT)-like permease